MGHLRSSPATPNDLSYGSLVPRLLHDISRVDVIPRIRSGSENTLHTVHTTGYRSLVPRSGTLHFFDIYYCYFRSAGTHRIRATAVDTTNLTVLHFVSTSTFPYYDHVFFPRTLFFILFFILLYLFIFFKHSLTLFRRFPFLSVQADRLISGKRKAREDRTETDHRDPKRVPFRFLADRLGYRAHSGIREDRSKREIDSTFQREDEPIQDAGRGSEMFTCTLATRQVPFPRTVAFDRAISVGRYDPLRFSPFTSSPAAPSDSSCVSPRTIDGN